MTPLILQSDARLMAIEDMPAVRLDVSSCAHQYLFTPVELAQDVTLADIFGLLEKDPVLVQVMRRNFAEELLAHARKGALKNENPYDPAGIEYLELYCTLDYNTATKAVESNYMVQFHGIGFELQEDRDDAGFPQRKGTRTQWSVSFTDLREMLHLPLRVNTKVLISEGDFNAKGFGRELLTVHIQPLTLGQVLNGVLWELSFHGAPEDQAQARSGLLECKAELNAAMELDAAGEPSGLVDASSVFEDLERPGIEAMFESIGGRRVGELMRALRELEDDESVPEGLARVLGSDSGQVQIRADFQAIPARAFRTAMRAARSND